MFVAQVENTHLSLQISFRSLVDDPLHHWPSDRGHHGCSAIWVRLVGMRRVGQRPFFFALGWLIFQLLLVTIFASVLVCITYHWKEIIFRPEAWGPPIRRTRWLEVWKDVRKWNRPLFCAARTSGLAFVQVKAYPEVLAAQKNAQFRFQTPFRSSSSTSSSLSLAWQLTP